jgi:hypothetical protein
VTGRLLWAITIGVFVVILVVVATPLLGLFDA